MEQLKNEHRLTGDIRHRIVPRYVNEDLFNDIDNQVFVTYEEHFYIHRLLFLRDNNAASYAAWFCLLKFEIAHIKQQDIDDLLDRSSLWFSGENNAFYGHKHTEAAKSTMRAQKLKYYRENPEALVYLRNLYKGKPGRPHTEKHKQHMSQMYKGKGNPMAGVNLWNNPASQRPNSQKAYSMMAEMYDFYQEHKHKKRGWGYKAFADHIGWRGSQKCFITPMKYVIDNGDPRLNEKWLEFYNDYITR